MGHNLNLNRVLPRSYPAPDKTLFLEKLFRLRYMPQKDTGDLLMNRYASGETGI